MMSFGLKNAPAVFSKIFTVAFRDYIHRFLEVFMDESTIYSLDIIFWGTLLEWFMRHNTC